jgi:hypothetical protein
MKASTASRESRERATSTDVSREGSPTGRGVKVANFSRVRIMRKMLSETTTQVAVSSENRSSKEKPSAP